MKKEKLCYCGHPKERHMRGPVKCGGIFDYKECFHCACQSYAPATHQEGECAGWREKLTAHNEQIILMVTKEWNVDEAVLRAKLHALTPTKQ